MNTQMDILTSSPDQPSSAGAGKKTAGWLDVLPRVADVLRGYQRELLGRVATAIRTVRRVCVQAPTGAGKTHLIASVAAAAAEHGLQVLILATRTRLVRQLHDRLDTFGVRHGVIAASLRGLSNLAATTQVASIDTLHRRCIASNRMPLPPADVVIFDEAHLALGKTRQEILNSYPNAWIFGFTATPAKTSGASLRDQFDELVMGPSVSELVEMKTLVPPRIFNVPVITQRELKSVGTDAKTGDYRTSKLSKSMRRPKLVGDVVENWLAIANGQRTLVFACDKAHGSELLLRFRQAGVAAEQLTDADSDETREEVIARLESGVTTVVINCFLLSYGIDIPLVDCVVLARPTRSVVMYLQSIGRGMRSAPGKTSFTLIDHGRVIENLGRPLYDRDWSLDSASNVNAEARERMERAQVDEKPRTCGECKYSWLVTEEGCNCPNCGWVPTPAPKPVNVVDATLVESKEVPADWNGIRQFYAEACQWYANRWPERWGAKEKSGRWWAWSQTRTKFKRPDDERMPRGFWDLNPVQPSDAVAGWLKHSMIRYAKGRQRAAQAEVRA